MTAVGAWTHRGVETQGRPHVPKPSSLLPPRPWTRAPAGAEGPRVAPAGWLPAAASVHMHTWACPLAVGRRLPLQALQAGFSMRVLLCEG